MPPGWIVRLVDAVERLPPVNVSPLENNPPAAERSLMTVDVPAVLLEILPPVRVNPLLTVMPAASRLPVSRVEVPDTVFLNPPPVRESPADALIPVAESPCTTVDVPVVCVKRLPALMVSPFDALMPAAERLPESTVDVPDTVERILPPVMVMPDVVARYPDAESPVYRVEVAAVVKLPTPCIEKREPGVEVPTPRLPPLIYEYELRERKRLPSDEESAVSLRYIDPVPVRTVPLTQRLDANVEVALVPVPRTSRNPAMVDVAVVDVACIVPNCPSPARM